MLINWDLAVKDGGKIKIVSFQKCGIFVFVRVILDYFSLPIIPLVPRHKISTIESVSFLLFGFYSTGKHKQLSVENYDFIGKGISLLELFVLRCFEAY